MTGRRARRHLTPWVLLALAPFAGCTSATNENPYLPPAPTGTGGSGPGPGTGPGPSGTVNIWLDAPVEGMIATSGTLMDIRAHAVIESGSDYIDTTTVRATVTTRVSSSPLDSTQLVYDPTSTDGLYTGRLSLGDLSGGEYRLTVTAMSSGGMTGSYFVDFVIDAGPSLIVRSPAFGGHYKTSLVIDLSASDPSGIKSLTATVAATDIPLTSLADPPDTYRGIVDFNIPMPPWLGEQILTVTAISNTDRRVERQVIFSIDNEGPVITMTTPAPGTVVGSVVRISATVQDAADVLDSSVIAIIGDQRQPALFELALKPAGGGSYYAYFDTARLTECPTPPTTGPCIVYPTISFRASDQLGNESTLGYDFAVDNIPPVSDLDSADVRVMDKDGYCSRRFDPLALNRWIGDMPNDGVVAPQVFDLRARVEDHGNAPVGIKEVPIAGIDSTATDVYILNDTSLPLIVDTDGDGTCDAINPKLIPTVAPPTQNNHVLKVRLAGVPKQGAPDFRSDGDLPPPSICTYPPTAVPPVFLCSNAQPYTTISYAHGAPTIWSVEPISPAWCMGGQFDTRANRIDDESWACLAVQSSDQNGNQGVSPPLRVFVRYNGNGAGAAPTSGGPPPACTGVYNRATDTVTPGTCTFRGFDTIDYCFDGDC